MQTPLGLLKKFQNFDSETMVDTAFSENESAMITAQRDQMRKGERSDGEEITPGLLSNAYAQEKKASGGIAQMGVPDLKDTGAFQNAITYEVSEGVVYFNSTDEKTEDLVEKYTEDIFGLSDKTFVTVRPSLWKSIRDYCRKNLGI